MALRRRQRGFPGKPELGGEVFKNSRVGGEDGRTLFTNMVPDVERDRRVCREGSRCVTEVGRAHGVAVAEEPCQGRSGRRKMGGANEGAPNVGCVVADLVGLTVKKDHGRWGGRRVDVRSGGQHLVRRDGDGEDWAQRKSPLCVGGSLPMTTLAAKWQGS